MDIFPYIALLLTSLSCTNDAPTNNNSTNVTVQANVNQSNKSDETNLAQKAAQQASIAKESQQVAGQQASHQIKQQLADKAILAAQSADAAMAGKQIIVNEIESELHEAQKIEQKEKESLKHSRPFVKAALQSAHDSEAQVKLLAQATQVAQSNAANALAAAKGAQLEICEKQDILNEVKNHKEKLNKELNTAKADMLNTKKSAEIGASAAHNAMDDAKKSRRSIKTLLET